MDLKIHHIGYLVKKMNKGIDGFRKLGFESLSDIIYDDYRQIDICFIGKDGYIIELISPKTKNSVVAGMMKRIGNCPYHICYSCENIESAENELKKHGFMRWGELHEAIALDNRKVDFLINPYVGIIELLEEK